MTGLDDANAGIDTVRAGGGAAFLRLSIRLGGVVAVVAMIGSTALLVWYGHTVFKDCPLIDDWAFVDRLKAYLSGEAGIGYFFERHNGHPSLLSRLLFYIAYRTSRLDFRVIRWHSIGILLVTAALIGWQLFHDLTRGAYGTRAGRAVALILVAPACGLVLSLGHWEVLTLAMAVDNCAVNALAIAAILLTDHWRRRDDALSLAAAVATGLLATMCMLQGALVWPAMALTLLLAPRRRGTVPVLLGLATASLISGLAALKGVAAAGGTKIAFDALYAVKGILILQGLPFLGAIHNGFIPLADLAVGLVIVLLTATALLVFFAAMPAQRSGQCKYIGIAAFGGATALLIALGRHQYTAEQLAASRYATALLPAAVGLWGFLAVSAQGSRVTERCLIGLYVITVAGLAITDYQEARLAAARGQTMVAMQEALRDGAILNDNAAVRAKFYVDEQFAPLIAVDRAFLKERKLSLFR